MAAGKNQAEAIVFEGVVFFAGHFGRERLRFEMAGEIVLRSGEAGAAAQGVDGFEAGGGNEPWARVGGDSTFWPEAQGSGEGFVHGFFGKIKITEQTDESGQDSSGVDAIEGVEIFADLFGGALGHEDDVSKAATPKQFRKRRSAFMRWILVGSGGGHVGGERVGGGFFVPEDAEDVQAGAVVEELDAVDAAGEGFFGGGFARFVAAENLGDVAETFDAIVDGGFEKRIGGEIGVAAGDEIFDGVEADGRSGGGAVDGGGEAGFGNEERAETVPVALAGRA